MKVSCNDRSPTGRNRTRNIPHFRFPLKPFLKPGFLSTLHTKTCIIIIHDNLSHGRQKNGSINITPCTGKLFKHSIFFPIPSFKRKNPRVISRKSGIQDWHYKSTSSLTHQTKSFSFPRFQVTSIMLLFFFHISTVKKLHGNHTSRFTTIHNLSLHFHPTDFTVHPGGNFNPFPCCRIIIDIQVFHLKILTMIRV